MPRVTRGLRLIVMLFRAGTPIGETSQSLKMVAEGRVKIFSGTTLLKNASSRY
jgi:hypothetical protein